jgi:hypothetical protein
MNTGPNLKSLSLDGPIPAPNSSTTTSFFSSDMILYGVIGILVAVVVVGVAYIFWKRSNTMPKVQGFQDVSGAEGFFGGVAVGAGAPDCLRTSSEASQVYATFANRNQTTEEGSADLDELRLLLSKLACFKKDLIGTAGVVEATRYQAYATSMDLEPIAETTARCFAKTIPARDLDLSLEKWSKRGMVLINRLCTSVNLTEGEARQVEAIFDSLIRDVSDIAKSTCLSGEPMVGGSPAPRSPSGYSDPTLQELGPYKGYY